MAAAETGRDLLYYTFQKEAFGNDINNFVGELQRRDITVGKLHLLEYLYNPQTFVGSTHHDNAATTHPSSSPLFLSKGQLFTIYMEHYPSFAVKGNNLFDALLSHINLSHPVPTPS